MKRKRYNILLLLAISLSSLQPAHAQQVERKFSIASLLALVEENHPSLAVSKTDIYIAKQGIEVAKNAMLPTISTALQGYYLGDAQIITKDLSDNTRINMPHLGNTFSVDASQLIWRGGMVRNGIEVQKQRKELTELSYKGNEQNIKLLVLGYYLDLYKLINQKKIYEQNIILAEQRLLNINRFFGEGMVTRNDVIRGQLQLSNLRLALQVLENNRQILNRQLTTALGLTDQTQIIPDEALLTARPQILAPDNYRKEAVNHPMVLMTQKAVEMVRTSENITRAELMPALSAFAGNRLARPITTSLPARDMYYNGWSAGLSLNFNIDALYKTPKKIKQIQFEKDKALAQANEARLMIDVAINAAYIKYNEALTQNNTLATNKNLADENYRIMESKYNNQLAILLDLIDASNQKLDAGLQYVNSEINIIYAYYKLLKESGKL
ncbi:TolC family protein [Emticicia sp. 21SJ11W-3]|uniref:TolC family protein n=1 Tax=Emticicia sp. 21SJ11W-3 TaxID=2916755 RepID=UPI00209F5141|nr:TolC family protein [Emticicia sp. 21SJ11W-3]UTA66693.1 TolC family protein [Emticicia sp. 21SJ11W-3]